ncbi:MAG: CARDB domain-containing protein [Methanomassiliicoccales archaeon]
MSSSIENRIISFAIVWCLVTSLFAGLLIVVPEESEAALPSILPNGDVIIGSDYEFSTWPINPNLNGAEIKMRGNLTIRSGGIVTINDGTLSFAQDIGMDRIPGTADDHVYKLIIEDGGRLILNRATLTTHLDTIFNYPSLGVLVRNGGVLQATDSVLKFPGHIVVDSSQLVLTDSVVTGHLSTDISKYCIPSYFPSDFFDDSAVILSVSSTCTLMNSRVERIYENSSVPLPPSTYNHNYPFASDDATRNLVQYTLSRNVNSFTAANTAMGPLVNITMDDSRYVMVGPGQTLSLGSVAIDGLVFPASTSYSITMHVKYKTDLGYDGTSYFLWSYENGALTTTTIQPRDTHLSYDPNVNIEAVESFAMPAMSSADLRNLNISFSNNAVSSPGFVYINRVWFDITFSLPTYRNITMAGSSSLIALDTYLDVDFNNDRIAHNQLNVRDASNAYLYGVWGDVEEEDIEYERVPAYFISSGTTSAYPISKGTLDNTTSSLATLRSVDGVYYDVAANQVMALENFNVGDISGPLSAVTLTVSVRVAAGYVVDQYVKWGTSWSLLYNTSIRPSSTTLTTYNFDLYSAGITDVSKLNNLKISFTNTRAQLVQFDRIAITVETGPAIYVYRWADVNAVDEQQLPISGAFVNATLLSNGGQAYYYTPSGVSPVPPSEVLSYLNRNTENYKITNESGSVMLPLLSDILTRTDQLPNLVPIHGYNLFINYTNVSSVFYSGQVAISFDSYPAIGKENQTRIIEFTMPDLYLDRPDLQINSMSVAPSTIFVDDIATISVQVRNNGLTGARNVVVNLTDSLSTWTGEQTVGIIGPGATVEVQFSWVATPAGMHTITARVDPKNVVAESSEVNNERSLSFTVLANLPELSVTSTDISFTPQPAFSNSPVTTTVVVSNALGRADAKDVTVSFYIGDPRTSGQLIGTNIINVTKGAANTTNFVWTPTEIGTYDIYVQVNAGQSPKEYSYANNLASRAITVDLSLMDTDLVVDDSNVVTFSGASFSQRGRVIVMEQGTLIIRSATFTMFEDYDGQFQIYVMDQGRLIIEGATLATTKSIWMYVMEDAIVWVNDSLLSDGLKIKLDGYSQFSIERSTVHAELVAPTSSNSILRASSTTFTKSLSSFGGKAIAYLTSVSTPSLVAKENALIYHYRNIEVTVVDLANNRIAGAEVVLRYYVNRSDVSAAVTNVAGALRFAALCDVITATGSMYHGRYALNASYAFMARTYYASEAAVSLSPYSAPLSVSDAKITLVIQAIIPISEWDIIVDDNNIVELEGTTFNHRGRVIVMDNGALRIRNGGLAIDQDSNYQFQIFVQDNGRLELYKATLSSDFNIWLYASGNAVVRIEESTVHSSVIMRLDGLSKVYLLNSTIGSGISAPSSSSARVWAWNTTFLTSWNAFGGNAVAYLVSVRVPALRPIEGALVLHYRWVKATVLDGNNYAIPNAVVQIRFYVNGTLFSSVRASADGTVLFAALCDRIDANGANYLGNYRLNATYWFQGTPYESSVVPVSLAPYAEPLSALSYVKSISIPSALPDLDPPIFVSNSQPYRNENVTITTHVTNVGVVDANNVMVRFKDGTSVISDIIVPKISPGETVIVSVVWRASYPLGLHNISVVIDPLNLIKELTVDDNTNWTLVEVRGVVDLYISEVDVTVTPASPTTNSSASITVVVHNSGDIAASNVNVSFTDVMPGGQQVLIGYALIPTVPGLGGTGAASVSWVPTIPGNHVLIIRVNVGIPPIPEQITSNNNVSYPVIVRNYADLTPSSITFRPLTAIYVGNQVFVDAAIANIGQTAAANVVVNFWEGSIGTGRLFDTKTISSVASGQTVTVTGSWIVQPIAGAKFQTRTIWVDVNPARTVIETNYNNNRLSQGVIVVDNRPDLMFVGTLNFTSGSSEVTEAVLGETIVMRVSLKNDGFTNAMGVKIRFEAGDSDGYYMTLFIVSRDVRANETIRIEQSWIVNTTTSGNYTIRATVDYNSQVNETNEGNNILTKTFRVNPPVPQISISVPLGEQKVDSNIIVSGVVTNSRTGAPLPNQAVVLTIMTTGLPRPIIENVTVYTGPSGVFQGTLHIPANVKEGTYVASASVTIDNKTVSVMSAGFQIVRGPSETSVPFWVWLLIIALVVLIIVAFSFKLYRGLGRMVECGECGALIPESSKRCPKCGVEFETGTAKCSNCGAWIPVSSSECPECGVKFVSEPLPEEESDYVRKMREQYEAYVAPFREQGKQALGKKYSEAKFQEWWKKQPSYISFEKWLSQEEQKRKAAGSAFPCPICGTLNPKGSNICSKCGTVFDKTMMSEAPTTASTEQSSEPSKPARRIVRRAAEKKTITKKPEEAGQPSEEQQQPEEQKAQ